MTLRVASTTDSEAEVEAAAVTPASTATPGPDGDSSDLNTTPETVEVAPRYQQPEVAVDEAATSETIEAAGDGEESATEIIAEEPEVEPEREVADVEAAEAQEDDPGQKPKKRRRRGRSYKDRASQLAREKAVEKSRADALQAELDAIKAASKLVAPPPPTPPVKPEAPKAEKEETVSVAPRYRQPDVSPTVAQAPSAGRPNQDDFETYEQYQEALVDWKVTLRLTERDEVDRERIERDSTNRAREKVVAAHEARIDTFRSGHDDFDAVIAQGKDLPMTQPMQDSVLNSDMGPAVMYHLCRFPEECDRIAALPPMVAIREMGKLEARIEAAQTGPVSSAASVTQAPRPIKPVGGGATASTVPLDQLDYQSYRRAREKGAGR